MSARKHSKRDQSRYYSVDSEESSSEDSSSSDEFGMTDPDTTTMISEDLPEMDFSMEGMR